MPWTLDTPIPNANGDITTVYVSGAIIDNANKCLRINYSEGYMDGDEFISLYNRYHDVKDISEMTNDLTGAVITEATSDFSDMAATSTPDPAVTWYEALKSLFYTELHDADIIGDGTLSWEV